MIGNLGNSIAFGLPLPILTGGAGISAIFIQLNYYWLKHAAGPIMCGSEFTDADVKARVARSITKKRTWTWTERSAPSGLAVLAKSL